MADPWIHGVDVSHWQRVGLALPPGIRFAWIKASQGRGRDSAMAAHHADLVHRGITVGAYCYYDFAATPEVNAETFLAATRGHAWGLPHALDAEDDTGLPKAEVAELLLAFLDLVERGTGRVPVVYTGRYWWDSKVGGDQRFARYPLWLAGYPQPNDGTPPVPGRTYPVPAPWTRHTVWQYSDSGGQLDRNVSTEVDLAGLLGEAPTIPTTPPTPKGPLMALTDAEQTELLTKVRELHADYGVSVEPGDVNPATKKVVASGTKRWQIGKLFNKAFPKK